MESSITMQHTPQTSENTRTNTKQVAIAIACLSFFPMVYLIGKALMAA